MLLLAAGFGFYILKLKKQPTKTGPTPEQVKQAATVEADRKKDLIENTSNSNDSSPAESTSPSVDLSARQETNGSVTVIAKLYKVAAGNCSLTVTNGSKSVTKTAAIIYQAEFSTCAGFNLARDELGAGKWTIGLKTDGGLSKTINQVVSQ